MPKLTLKGIILGAALLATGAAAGRYSAIKPSSEEPKTKYVLTIETTPNILGGEKTIKSVHLDKLGQYSFEMGSGKPYITSTQSELEAISKDHDLKLFVSLAYLDDAGIEFIIDNLGEPDSKISYSRRKPSR